MIQSIHMCVVRHTWASQKFFPILSLQYVKTEMRYDADLLHVGIHRNSKLIQLFQAV